jgi:hypothetical protein
LQDAESLVSLDQAFYLGDETSASLRLCGFAFKAGVSMSSELDVSSKRKAAEKQSYQRQAYQDDQPKYRHYAKPV